MKLSEIMNGIKIKELKGVTPDTDIGDVCYNSQKVKPGDLYIAVKGFKNDGNKYALTAVKAGAVAVVTEEKPKDDIPYIIVDNSRAALADMSANLFGHPSNDFMLVGVTGTNGKTTTSCWIREIFQKALGIKVGLIGTNQIITGNDSRPAERTTPESYDLQRIFSEMRNTGCKCVVMEVSSHALVLERVRGCDFDIGVFTNLTQDHLDFHKTMEAYRDAKGRLFDMCKVGVFNVDDEAGRFYAEHSSCKKLTYGIQNDDGSVAAKNIRLLASSVVYEALKDKEISRMTAPAPGMFSVYNSLAAVTAALAAGIALDRISDAMTEAHPVRGRAEVVHSGDFTVIVDYAHTPDGVENILKAAKNFSAGRIICVFGCGGDRDRTKRPKMGSIVSELSDIAVVTSDNPRSEQPSAIISDIIAGMNVKRQKPHIIEDRRQAIIYALETARNDDTVLILGKGHEDYQEINGVKNHFDDREEIESYFACASQKVSQ